MRDKRFVACHRGGPLKKEQQIQLIEWACVCVEHAIPMLEGPADDRLMNALRIAREWVKGNASVGDARKASLQAITLANEQSDPVSIALARAAGHAVATAHMADHSMGGALYTLKAIKISGKSIEAERKWQNEQLPTEIRDLVMNSILVKGKAFKLG